MRLLKIKMLNFKKVENTLIGEFKFKNFTEAFGFLAQVAILQEKHNHHAKIENMYNRVTLTLTTHDAGNTVTDKDYKLAEEIEKILK